MKIWLFHAAVVMETYVLIKTQLDLCGLTFATSTLAGFTSAATDLCQTYAEFLKKKTSKFHFSFWVYLNLHPPIRIEEIHSVVYTLLVYTYRSLDQSSLLSCGRLWNLYWDLGHSTGPAASISNLYRLLPQIILLTDRLINPNRALS
jgi:hypothetical protein